MLKKLSLLLPIALAACADPTVIRPAHYTDLSGWQSDHVSEAYKLFVDSCQANETRPAAYTTNDQPIGARAQWEQVCASAYAFPNPTDEEARGFFEKYFTPWRVETKARPEGTLTGYYEPLLHGAMHRHGPYTVPVYGVPDDLVKGTSYLTREQIEAGGLDGHAKILLYVDDPVMLFFLHIQGSGKVRLENGALVGLQYAAQNGREFVPIGRLLKESGEVPEPSMQSIRDWLYANPDRASQVMDQNPSYIFFKLSPGDQMAKGALKLPLTPMRSIAVDDERAAYGVPTFVNTTISQTGEPLQRLFVPQDTGGALHGPHRIDIFFGRGEQAELQAGHQNSQGDVYWLLPAPPPEENPPVPVMEFPAEAVPSE